MSAEFSCLLPTNQHMTVIHMYISNQDVYLCVIFYCLIYTENIECCIQQSDENSNRMHSGVLCPLCVLYLLYLILVIWVLVLYLSYTCYACTCVILVLYMCYSCVILVSYMCYTCVILVLYLCYTGSTENV